MAALGKPGIWWLASYPKSGNTWMRTFIANLLADGAAPVDINALDTGGIASARALLDEWLMHPSAEMSADELDHLRPRVNEWIHARATEARFLKIHDALRAGPGVPPLVGPASAAGVICIVRNPLDVAHSAANHWGCSMDESVERLCNPAHGLSLTIRHQGRQVRQHLGRWTDHVMGWAGIAAVPRLLLRYEDLLEDPHRHFAEVARFVGLPDDAGRVARAVAHSRFDVLAAQEAQRGFGERPEKSQKFFRSGQAGAWRERLQPGQVARIIDAQAPGMRRFGYLDALGQPV